MQRVEMVLKDPRKRGDSQYLRSLGRQLTSAGHPDPALTIAERLEQVVSEEALDRRPLWGLYHDIARVLGSQGRLAEAQATADKIGDVSWRQEALRTAVLTQSSSDLTGAFRFAKTLQPLERGMQFLADSARRAGNESLFREAMDLALKDAQQMDANARAKSLVYISGALEAARAASFDSASFEERVRRSAIEVAQESQDYDVRRSAAEALVDLGALEEALDLLKELEEDRGNWTKDAFYRSVAEAFARRGELEKALQLSREALPIVAEKQAEAGQFRDAIESALQIDPIRQTTGDWRRNETLRAIAAEQARADLIDQSLSTVRLIGPLTNRTYAEERFSSLLQLAEVLDSPKEGQEAVRMLKRAEALLKELPEDKRNSASESLARAYQSLRAEDYLRDLARTATGLERANILARLAAGHLEAGERERFERTLQEAVRAAENPEGPEPQRRSAIWFRIAAVAHDGQKPNVAEHALRNLRRAAEAALAEVQAGDVMAGIVAWGPVAIGYARLDRWDELQKAISDIDDASKRSLAYSAVGVLLQNLGGKLERLKTASVFPEARTAGSGGAAGR